MGFWSFRFWSTKLYRLLAERMNGFEGNFDIIENATMGKIENYEIWAWEHFTLQSRTGRQGQIRARKGFSLCSKFSKGKTCEVLRWEIFMEQELKFGLDLG